VRCPSCSSDVADGRRFCPSCGTPQPATAPAAVGAASGASPGASSGGGTEAMSPATATIVLPDGTTPAPDPTAGTGGGDANATTRVLDLDAPAHPTPPGTVDGGDAVARDRGRDRDGGGSWRARLAPAGEAVRHRAGDLADRYRTAPADVRLALVGTVVTVASFLLLPYAAHRGTAAEIGGRLWWRPLAAVAATALLATTLRARRGSSAGAGAGAGNAVDRLLAAVVVATIGATEAGLVALVSREAAGARIGYYGMLAGLVTVLVATVRAARRRCGAVPAGSAEPG
jgi:hypothetical protein